MSPAESAAADSILASAKYAPVERPVIERVVADAVRRYGPKRAEGEAKRLLHQIWGMYYGGAKLRTPAADDLEATMRLHQSTKERLPFLRNFYERIFAVIGQPESIADYACGLNPLAYASLGWPFPSRYLASDIDTFTVGILNAGFERLRVEDRFSARLDDLMTGTPKPADVTFLLKVLPVLELQAKGAGRAVLDKQTARHVVVSYPLKSVSGREKGMGSFYREQFYALIQHTKRHVEELTFPNELVFVCTVIDPSAALPRRLRSAVRAASEHKR